MPDIQGRDEQGRDERPGDAARPTPHEHDEQAASRGQARGGATAAERAEPHPGWSAQSQASYDAGDSGGWGGPAPHQTGPMPRLRRPHDEAGHTAGRTPDEDVTFAPAQGYDGLDSPYGEPDTAAEQGLPGGAAPADPGDAYGYGVYGARASQGTQAGDPGQGGAPYGPGGAGHPGPGAYPPGAPRAAAPGRGTATSSFPGAAGLGALFDLTFRRRATSAIAPFAYTVLLVFLLLDYMRSVYEYSNTAAGLGAAALGGLIILFVVGLFKIVVVAAVARLALELCLDVADIARSRRDASRD